MLSVPRNLQSDPILWLLDQFLSHQLYPDYRQSPLLIIGKIRFASNSVVTLSSLQYRSVKSLLPSPDLAVE